MSSHIETLAATLRQEWRLLCPPVLLPFRNLRHGMAMSPLRDRDNGTPDPWPLVGRTATLADLEDQLLGPHPRGVVLAGATGVGRTAVGRALLEMADERGADTAHVTATRSAAQVPFGAVAPLLPAALDPSERTDHADTLRRTLDALAARSRERPLVLFVDDAHLLDDASATLLHQVAAAGS